MRQQTVTPIPRTRRVALTLSKLSLASCAVGPNFKPPAPPAAAAYTAAPTPTPTASAPGAALGNNPTVAAAQATLGQARETYAAQGGSILYPQSAPRWARKSCRTTARPWVCPGASGAMSCTTQVWA